MARLLNTYQLWLDDLYPRAKFADGLSLIEKLGHKKRVQSMRREWIDEGKPRVIEEPEEETPALAATTGSVDAPHILHDEANTSVLDHTEAVMSGALPTAGSNEPLERDGPEEDELDALLAEDGAAGREPYSIFGTGIQLPRSEPPDKQDFDDEEEAMAGMEW